MQQYNKTIRKMINYDNVTKECINKNDLNRPQIPDNPYRILIIGGSGSGKTNALLNLKTKMIITLLIKFTCTLRIHIKQNIKILIKNVKKNGLKTLEDPKPFIEYSNSIQDVYKNIEEYKLSRKYDVLIVFDDMIANMISNKTIVTEPFIRGRKLNFFTVFIAQFYCQVPKGVRLNCTHFFIMKIL